MEEPKHDGRHLTPQQFFKGKMTEREMVLGLTLIILGLAGFIIWEHISSVVDQAEGTEEILAELDTQAAEIAIAMAKVDVALQSQSSTNESLRLMLVELKNMLESNFNQNRSLRIAVLELLKRERVVPPIE